MNMRILIWVQQFHPNIGGVETQVMNLAQQLVSQGHACIIFTEQTKDAWRSEEEYNGIKIYRFPFITSFISYKLSIVADISRTLQRLVNEFKPDILHINMNTQCLMTYRLYINKIINRPPTLITLHGMLQYVFNRDLDHLFRSVDWVNCVSKHLLQEFLTFHPGMKNKASYIYNGIQCPNIESSPLPYDPVRILCLGRITYEKGFDQAIAAFYMVSKTFPTVELIIAGEGNEYGQIVNLVKMLKLTNKVKFLKKVNPECVPGLINQATMLIVPSRYETFGIAAVEGTLLARPVIATNVGGLKELFTHHETGLLVEHEDIDDLAAQIEYLIQHPDVAHALGQRGRKHMINKFNAETMANKYEAIYSYIINNKANEARQYCD